MWLEAAEEPLATEISFFVTDDTVTNFQVNGVKPCVPVGMLPTRPGKTLWAIASHRTQDTLKEWAQDLINQIAADQETKEKLSGTATGDTLRFNATTYAEDGGACWMRFPSHGPMGHGRISLGELTSNSRCRTVGVRSVATDVGGRLWGKLCHRQRLSFNVGSKSHCQQNSPGMA